MLTWLFWRENSKQFYIFRRCLWYAYTTYYKLTLSCRSTLAPASSSSKTTSVLLFLAASINAEYPNCVVCSETLRTNDQLLPFSLPLQHLAVYSRSIPSWILKKDNTFSLLIIPKYRTTILPTNYTSYYVTVIIFILPYSVGQCLLQPLVAVKQLQSSRPWRQILLHSLQATVWWQTCVYWDTKTL